MALKIIALGTGVCTNGLDDGMPNRYPPGFLVDYNNQLLLLDASEGVRYRIQKAGYDYGFLEHVAITHAHPDHCALPQLIQAKLCRVLWDKGKNDIEKLKNLAIYMHEDLARGFQAVWDWHHPEGTEVYKGTENWKVEPVGLNWEKEIFSGLKLKAFNVYHGFGQHPSLGYRIETDNAVIVYTGDTGLTDSLFDDVFGADLLIIDSAVPVGRGYTGGYGHLAPEQIGLLAYRSQVKNVWLTHYPSIDTNEAMQNALREQGYTGGIQVVKDNDVWQK